MNKERKIMRGLVLMLILLAVMGAYALQSDTVTFARPGLNPSAQGNTPEIILDFGPDVPFDADLTGVDSLAEAQRAFDTNSWLTFIALNWPADEAGNPLPTLSDEGLPQWQFWKESFEVFLEDGSEPAPWGSPRSDHPICPEVEGDTTRILHLTNKVAALELVDQAFSGPLWDQNGVEVRYEILLNEDEFNYIVENSLYNLDGQIAFAQSHHTLHFPAGDPETQTIGAIELKLAWKVMGQGDIQERFYTEEALIPTLDSQGNLTGVCEPTTVGLVGMHIAHKTTSSPQWIWGTFEHVDNLQVNSLEQVGDQFLTPSFYDPTCPHCPVNVTPVPDANGVKRTQVMRVIPIDRQTAELNRAAQEILRESGSVWQYYELVGTQWPTDAAVHPSTPQINQVDALAPQPAGRAPQLIVPPIDSVNNKAGGRPYPVYLTNSTMETYFQVGNQPAVNQEENVTSSLDNSIVFGSESCIGCHSSAGIAGDYTVDPDGAQRPVFDGQLTGDFSWLPQQKACWHVGENRQEGDSCQAAKPTPTP